MTDPTDFEPVVDDVARRMTIAAASSPDDLTARVAVRLTPRAASRDTAWWLRPGVLVPATAALAVATLAGAMALRGPTRARVVDTHAAASSIASLSASGTPADAHATDVLRAETSVDTSAAIESHASIVDDSDAYLPFPRLVTDQLRPMASIQPTPLSAPLLDVTPIGTEPLAIAPLDIGGKD